MMRMLHIRAGLGFALLFTVHGQAVAADDPILPPSQSDFGGTGLLQMPSARMAPEGEFSMQYSLTDSPYNRLSASIQLLDWLESTLRYTEIDNRLYGPADFSGSQSLKDKGVDIKARLWQEGYFLPTVSVGLRDLAGTEKFGSEFIAASKRFYDLDFTLGMGWGYLSNQQHIDNPFGKISDKFYDRPQRPGGDQGGKVGVKGFFRGEHAAFFGGVEYHTPWRPLRLKLEYDANDYQNEPLNNTQSQKSPFNFGMVYRVNDWVDISAGYERGDTWMLGITLRTNFQSGFIPRKLDPAPEQVLERGLIKPVSFAELAETLQNKGLAVSRIRVEGDNDLVIYGEERRFLDDNKALDRAARITTNRVPSDINSLTFVEESFDLGITRTTLAREEFNAFGLYERDDFASVKTREPINPSSGKDVYNSDRQDVDFDIYPDLDQSFGGPDAFYLYSLKALVSADYQPAPGWRLSGLLSTSLVDNLDQFKFKGSSRLPRVRTYVREYAVESDVNMPELQLTHFHRMSDDVYTQLYAGYLEYMYAGVGGEILYKPYGSRWALSANLNAVQQRDFDQHFGLRDYKTTTGHATAYYETGLDGVVASLSYGRYLAKDVGFTLNLSRRFSSGTVMGAFASFTNVSAEDYGEGSFTKGFYISVPFDLFSIHSSKTYGSLAWTPLTRDGGQPLGRKHELYYIYR